MLKIIGLECEYRSDEGNNIDKFYIPCLQQSCHYWRAVGYFTSRGLASAAKGLSAFIQRQGKMRLVASPNFENEDIEAITRGYEARDLIVERALLRRFESDLKKGLSTIVDHRLDCLAWLIAEGRLDVKIAVPSTALLSNGPGLYHEKIGLFFDNVGDIVAFTGSANETVGGLITNFESVDVYWSWDDPHQRVTRKVDNFRRLWEGATANLTIYPFPEAVKDRILQFKGKDRPLIDPESSAYSRTVFQIGGDSSVHVGEDPSHYRAPAEPQLPQNLKLRSYQEEAIAAWTKAGHRGLLEMATGTGKTVTAMASTVQKLQQDGRLYVVISAPYQHLVDQWAEVAQGFGFKPVLAFRSRTLWENELSRRTMEYRFGIRKVVCVITTHTTLATDAFQKIIGQVSTGALFVADEAHHLGATSRRHALPQGFAYRLGLSATPQRWFDDEGTQALMDYFGGSIYEFGLKSAIAAGCLTPYTYHPYLVDLTDDEMEQYQEVSAKIARLFGKRNQHGDDDDSLLEALLRKRADILNRAANKLDVLRDLIHQEHTMDHALFYCAPGQIDSVMHLLGTEIGIPVHSFTAEESVDLRRELLQNFDKGILKGLVAMKCLDEGVDVPATRSAYIMASSSNPREFIQRRGRVLRLSPGKSHSRIHDLIAVPPKGMVLNPQVFNIERGIVRRELARFREFAETAVNHLQAVDVVWELAKRYNLLDF